MLKQCFKCRRLLDRMCFYAHPQMGDGLLGKCKECAKQDVKERYAAAIGARHAYERARNRTPARRQQLAASSRRRKTRHPEKARAWAAVSNALRDGKLVRQPCQVCGARAQAHHPDYSKPLDVQWLCFRHHREAHGQVVL